MVIIFFFSCKSDDDQVADNTLAALVAVNTIEIDNVIACASSSPDQQNETITYLYPRPGATDIRYFETPSLDVDKNDFTAYRSVAITPTDFFNGYLKKFNRISDNEKWVIITFFENGVLHISNPIRLKQLTKPTEFSDQVTIDTDVVGMPIFSWNDGVFDDNKIYFQVVSDRNDELLSGTYTFERQFQYYKLDNVVLNITRDTPPTLAVGEDYGYTLMGVSEDNWVNLLLQRQFQP